MKKLNIANKIANEIIRKEYGSDYVNNASGYEKLMLTIERNDLLTMSLKDLKLYALFNYGIVA